MLESIERNKSNASSPSPSSFHILQTILRERGVLSLWSGLSPRMVEGIFSGSVLLAAKEGLHTLLSEYASPMLSKSIGLHIPPSFVGFLSGAGGGAAQALVMGPTSLIVTACVAAASNSESEEVSAFQVAQRIIKEKGVFGLYRGAPAVAMRQATNWASRQGFTEFVRPRIRKSLLIVDHFIIVRLNTHNAFYTSGGWSRWRAACGLYRRHTKCLEHPL